MDEFEIKIVKYFNQLGNSKIDGFLAFVNSVPFLAFLWSFLVALAVIKNPEITKDFIVSVLIVTALHFGFTEGFLKHTLTKVFSKRRRPYVAYPEKIKSIGHRFSDTSFPSSHMATTAAMLFVILSFYPSLFIFGLLLMILMAFSRLHNGMHYPSDIVVGTILGILYGYIAIILVK